MEILLAPLAFAAAALAPAGKEVPRIVVEGFGSVETPANLASMSFDILGEGKTSDEAVKSLVAKASSVESALRSMDPALKLESESMQVEAIRGSDCKEDRYEETLHLSTGECAIVGYVAKQDFDV